MISQDDNRNQYNTLYGSKSYYWSKSPSKVCYEVLRRVPPTKPTKLLDIGCGEGRNSIFFARNGYEVHSFDISENGVEKTKTLCDEVGVTINAFQADMTEYRLTEKYDILFSTGVLHCVNPETRRELFDNYKEYTNVGGIHAFSIFVNKPFIDRAPDADPLSFAWVSGELMNLYSDWQIDWCTEEIFDCVSGGVPHKHAVNRIISRKVI